MTSADTIDQVPVGGIHCQVDPFAREFSTRCISCSEKPNKKGFYEVKLHDTILFPEGGGQPYDTGYINDVRVHDVQRHVLSHIHYTKEPISVGPVELKLDWQRRWDHMQQHSGQHLLSAVLDQVPYKIETSSWNLGEKKCYIELPTGTNKTITFTPHVLQEIEQSVNQHILKDTPIITHTEHAHEGAERPESLPDDYVGGGIIRTIEIEALDKNPCCGTHLARLGQLQCFKILHTESVRGGNTRIFFLFGQRVLDAFGASYSISRQIVSILSVPQEQFVENIQKIQQQSKEHLKRAKRLLESLASYTVKDVEETLRERDWAVVYREDADMEYLGFVANGLRDRSVLEGKNKVVVLAAGEKKTGGPIVITGGTAELVQQVGKVVMKILPGVKGGGKGRWQGKAQNWNEIESLEAALREELQK
ncbi:Alanyl-tRNA editing protein Aarsd1 [Choanephora cucurbitarum]|uniref:Alanyl-tRNA editing protein Aarsd1 n=1 Tax=Choanephora cucurbitarum TaxID=101091 RepID=A0A1C7NJN8_9FUNG|nr:Alanyl-tRNA editing protein Aarsd1 [Choanephora cucurbitarum]